MKILVIEDEKLLADSIKTLLEGKGFEVEVAYDGETGMEYAELGIYDLLILDVMMPKMDGYQVAREVRAKRCTTSILMLTAKSAVEDRIYGLNSGADYYLTKPFKASDDVRMMGFGAGMGLSNMARNSDRFHIESQVGVGTEITMGFDL